MKLRALLVDDEPLALERLRGFLRDQEDLEIVGECTNGLQAVDAVASLKPDLLFLDIQMPELDGFEVLEALDPEALPLVVFATAFDQYAIQAFEAQALDYLLKPFSRQRLLESLQRARMALESRTAHQKLDLLLKQLQQRCTRFVVHKDDKALVIQAKDVEAFEAEANYLWLYRGRETYSIRSTMNALERRLDPAVFLRTHRSWIVNLACVQSIEPKPTGGAIADTVSGLKVPVSSGNRSALEAALGR